MQLITESIIDTIAKANHYIMPVTGTLANSKHLKKFVKAFVDNQTIEYLYIEDIQEDLAKGIVRILQQKKNLKGLILNNLSLESLSIIGSAISTHPLNSIVIREKINLIAFDFLLPILATHVTIKKIGVTNDKLEYLLPCLLHSKQINTLILENLSEQNIESVRKLIQQSQKITGLEFGHEVNVQEIASLTLNNPMQVTTPTQTYTFGFPQPSPSTPFSTVSSTQTSIIDLSVEETSGIQKNNLGLQEPYNANTNNIAPQLDGESITNIPELAHLDKYDEATQQEMVKQHKQHLLNDCDFLKEEIKFYEKLTIYSAKPAESKPVSNNVNLLWKENQNLSHRLSELHEKFRTTFNGLKKRKRLELNDEKIAELSNKLSTESKITLSSLISKSS